MCIRDRYPAAIRASLSFLPSRFAGWSWSLSGDTIVASSGHMVAVRGNVLAAHTVALSLRVKLARQCAGTLIAFKAYLPPDGTLLMLIGKFRDDVLDVMDADRDPIPKRGTERHPLDELTSIELDTISGSAGILLDSLIFY